MNAKPTRKARGRVIDYYFSVLSDWAYFGGVRFEQLARRQGVAINHMPIDLAEIYKGSGGILLQERSWQRQDYRVVELERWSRHLGIPVEVSPKHYPTDHKLASGMIIAAKRAGLDCGTLANSILDAIWVENRDIADGATLVSIAEGHGMDGAALLAKARSKAMQDEYARNTREALKRGVFGSPFYFYNGDIFWGQDRLDFLERAVTAG